MHVLRTAAAFVVMLMVLAGLAASPVLGQRKPPAEKPPEKPDILKDVKVTPKVKWLTNYTQVELLSKKSNKPIMLYFCSSNACDFTKELDEQVVESLYFANWTKDKVIPVKVDFMRDSTLSKFQQQQNKDLKERFQISKVPAFVFVDPDGNVIGRAGYQQAKLRKEEKKGVPMTWVAHADSILEGKLPPEDLNQLEGIEAGVAYAKEQGLPLLMIMYNPKSVPSVEQVQKLLAASPVVKFINTSLAVTRVYWPEDGDTSPQAEATRSWLKARRIGESPVALTLYDPAEDKVCVKLTSFNPITPQPTIGALERALPAIEYKGEWLTSFRKARAIAAQQKRTLVIAYTGLTWSPYCQQLDKEVFQAQSFRDYSRFHTVLLRVDFPDPKLAKVEDKASKDRDELADLYAIRGFPTMVVLNAAGHKIATSGLPKGGPDVFLQQLKGVRDKDLARHDHPSQW